MSYTGSHLTKLPLPPSLSSAAGPTFVEGDGVFVIVGANGTGKSRLGSWIELQSALSKVAHRVSAQKSLAMPASASPKSVAEARAELLIGSVAGIQPGMEANRSAWRWGSAPATHPLADFGLLVQYLFSEKYATATDYLDAARATAVRVEPPVAKLDTVKRVWEYILPTRELVIEEGIISARPRGTSGSYAVSDLSDGERVIFYLIGHALAAPANGVLIVDEPELHLNRSIQALLWDAIEGERPDLGFAYLTHDVDFAASRAGAPKICLRAFDGAQWDWFLAPADSGIPEEVLLAILGGRKPALFVEGDETSLDYFFLRHIYSEANLTPAGGCSEVIHAVASFSKFADLHRLASAGLVDRDYRDANGVAHLATLRVFVLPFAEIENVLLAESVLRVVAASLSRSPSETDAIVAKVETMVLERLKAERERVVSSMSWARLEATLSQPETTARGRTDIIAAVGTFVGSIDVGSVYDAAQAEIDDILVTKDYRRALAVFDQKGLLSMASSHFGLKPGQFEAQAKRLITSPLKETLVSALRSELPTISF